MSKLVQIVASEPVRYSLDNGVTLSEFKPREVYSVPDHVANGMVKRKWAKHVTAADLETQDAADTEIEMGALSRAARPAEESVEAEAEEEDEGEEDDDDDAADKPRRRKTTKTKRKR